MVRGTGIEPARPKGHRNLNPAHGPQNYEKQGVIEPSALSQNVSEGQISPDTGCGSPNERARALLKRVGEAVPQAELLQFADAVLTSELTCDSFESDRVV